MLISRVEATCSTDETGLLIPSNLKWPTRRWAHNHGNLVTIPDDIAESYVRLRAARSYLNRTWIINSAPFGPLFSDACTPAGAFTSRRHVSEPAIYSPLFFNRLIKKENPDGSSLMSPLRAFFSFSPLIFHRTLRRTICFCSFAHVFLMSAKYNVASVTFPNGQVYRY